VTEIYYDVRLKYFATWGCRRKRYSRTTVAFRHRRPRLRVLTAGVDDLAKLVESTARAVEVHELAERIAVLEAAQMSSKSNQ
jgi:hypothetical protein